MLDVTNATRYAATLWLDTRQVGDLESGSKAIFGPLSGTWRTVWEGLRAEDGSGINLVAKPLPCYDLGDIPVFVVRILAPSS